MTTHWWVGGGSSTNWNAITPTNWSIIGSGGAGGAAIPLAGDDVIFDNGSGTGASVWNTSISLNSLNCHASRNLVTHSGSVTITISGGDLELPGGVGATYTATNTASLFTLTGTSGTQKITTNGKNLGALTLNGAGGTFQLQDNFNCTAASISIVTLTSGTFDCQAFTVNVSQFTGSGAIARVLKGSGLWTVSGTASATVFNLTNTTSLTSSNFTSSITFTGNTANVRTFGGGGLTTYGTITFGANASGGPLKITGANTLAAIGATGPTYVAFPNGTTTTITAPYTLAGTSGNKIFFSSDNQGVTATLSTPSGTPSLSWAGIRDITFAGGGTFTAYNSFDLGHNSGITINAPNVTRSRLSLEGEV